MKTLTPIFPSLLRRCANEILRKTKIKDHRIIIYDLSFLFLL
ncbi:hypothetical protein HMPREF3191_00779 [Veillonellaceae bacterium DNF00626]|nr:hypothetical protein HMPREF3191_00779 [Veillonellaceae bacterium DNF00626]